MSARVTTTPIGLLLPVVGQGVHRSQPWEATATPDDVVAIARLADRLGYDHLACSHHVAVPGPATSDYSMVHGGYYWDLAAAFAFLAAVTERIHLLSYSFVVGFLHPLELAKQFGTIDHLSGGRVVLGLGVGNLEVEFDTLGIPFADRGPRADDALRALRAIWGRSPVSYEGEFFEFHDFIVEPHAVRTTVPIWIAGATRRAARRAVEFGDAWMPTPASHGGKGVEELAQILDELGAPDDFGLVVSPTQRFDALERPDEVLAALAELDASRATVLNVRIAHRSHAHLLEQIEAFATVAGLEA